MKEKDYAISMLRLISFCMIVACHVFQYYGNELAWWLNSGVQVFLLISGFLYGQREKLKTKQFYRRNCMKILLDYYLYVVLLLPIYIYIYI